MRRKQTEIKRRYNYSKCQFEAGTKEVQFWRKRNMSWSAFFFFFLSHPLFFYCFKLLFMAISSLHFNSFFLVLYLCRFLQNSNYQFWPVKLILHQCSQLFTPFFWGGRGSTRKTTIHLYFSIIHFISHFQILINFKIILSFSSSLLQSCLFCSTSF